MRPTLLAEGRPQGKVQRHAGIGYELVAALDAPVLQVDQLADVLQFFDTCLPVVAKQLIEVPKIYLQDAVPQRSVLRQLLLAEQLVEVPTVPLCR